MWLIVRKGVLEDDWNTGMLLVKRKKECEVSMNTGEGNKIKGKQVSKTLMSVQNLLIYGSVFRNERLLGYGKGMYK